MEDKKIEKLSDLQALFDEISGRTLPRRIYLWFYWNVFEHLKPNNIKYMLIHWWQRRTRGFSDDVCWNLEYEMAKWILPRLRRYKEIKNGYPCELTEEQWDEYLSRMIRGFELYIANADTEPPFDIGWHEPVDDWRARHKECQKEMQENLDLFWEYYRHLWD